jgi:hypothetical protein
MAAARTYLSSSSAGAAALAYFDTLDIPIITNNVGRTEAPVALTRTTNTATGAVTYAFRPDRTVIYWDPHAAMVTTNVVYGRTPNGILVPLAPPDTSANASHQKLQSAALGLIHEIDHVNRASRDPNGYYADKYTPVPLYDDAEERRVISGLETTIAQALGEPTRTNHAGFLGVSPTGQLLPAPSPYGWSQSWQHDSTYHVK